MFDRIIAKYIVFDRKIKIQCTIDTLTVPDQIGYILSYKKKLYL